MFPTFIVTFQRRCCVVVPPSYDDDQGFEIFQYFNYSLHTHTYAYSRAHIDLDPTPQNGEVNGGFLRPYSARLYPALTYSSWTPYTSEASCSMQSAQKSRLA